MENKLSSNFEKLSVSSVDWEDNLFLNWNSLHTRLNSYYKAWSYKKKKHRKIKTYMKSL